MTISNTDVTAPDAAEPAAAPAPESDGADPAAAPAAPADKTPRNSFKKKRGAPRSAIRRSVVEVKKKRGPPRPHRKLEQEVLRSRIEKLQKRIDKSKDILEEAERHIDSYNKETKYREEDLDA